MTSAVSTITGVRLPAARLHHAQLAQQVQAADAGHVQVDDRRVVTVGRERIQHLFAVVDADHAMPRLLQQALQHHAVRGVVVGDQDVAANARARDGAGRDRRTR